MEKYPFLLRAASVVKIVAWVELVFGVIGAFIAGISMAVTGDGIGAGLAIFVIILGVLYSVVAWIFLLAASEIFRLLIDVEENTRKTAGG
jgi:hypothetical protein